MDWAVSGGRWGGLCLDMGVVWIGLCLVDNGVGWAGLRMGSGRDGMVLGGASLEFWGKMRGGDVDGDL